MPPSPPPEQTSRLYVNVDGQFPGTALDMAIAAAHLASPVVEGPNGMRHVIAPEGFRLHDVSDPHRLPPYAIGQTTVDDRDSFIALVNRFSTPDTVIFADYDKLRLVAFFDWHGAAGQDESVDPARPNPRAHRSILSLRNSEEYARWAAVEGKMLGQAAFAAFLEENAEDIIDPEPAVMIEISRDLEATQGVNFKASTRLESGDRSFVYETATQTKGSVKIPREFRVSIPLFNGEAPVTLRCAFRYRIEAGGLGLGFEWRRVEYQRQGQFRELAALVAEGTGRPVFMGRSDS